MFSTCMSRYAVVGISSYDGMESSRAVDDVQPGLQGLGDIQSSPRNKLDPNVYGHIVVGTVLTCMSPTVFFNQMICRLEMHMLTTYMYVPSRFDDPFPSSQAEVQGPWLEKVSYHVL